MSMSNTWETGLLSLLFNNQAFTGVGDASGLLPSGTTGSLYLSLHTSDPGEAGDQTTNETSYTNYVRLGVSRTSGAWTVSGPTASNAAQLQFAQCGVSGATITHVGIGTTTSGAGRLLYSGLITSLAVSQNITPTIAIGALTFTMD